jgi:rubrerythrin
MGKTLKDHSRTLWTAKADNPDNALLQIGCLQRIADATEVMAQNHVKLQADLEWYKTQYKLKGDRIDELKMSIRGYKAANTKLKNKLNAIIQTVNNEKQV